MLDKNITEIKESFYTDIKSVSSLKDVEEIRIDRKCGDPIGRFCTYFSISFWMSSTEM